MLKVKCDVMIFMTWFISLFHSLLSWINLMVSEVQVCKESASVNLLIPLENCSERIFKSKDFINWIMLTLYIIS